MAVHLAAAVDDVHGALTSPRVAKAAADAMEKSYREGLARSPLGADLRLSGFRGGPVTLEASSSPGRAELRVGGGTYALADTGRQQAGGRIFARGRRRGGRAPALSTPRGPRRSVRGSTSRGFRLTDRIAPDALEAAAVAAVKAAETEFAKAV